MFKHKQPARWSYVSAAFLVSFLLCPPAKGQGPQTSYYFEPTTYLSWAECRIDFDGGSHQRIGFMPVVSGKRAPFGTNKYSEDIDLRRQIVFVGDGTSSDDKRNCYEDVDVKGKVVMFVYDFLPTRDANSDSVEVRVHAALSRDVAGIILVSFEQAAPFLALKDVSLRDLPEVPIISINQSTASRILASSGLRPDEIIENWRSGKIPGSTELIAKLRLKIEGLFDKVETENFEFLFREVVIPRERILELATTNEESLKFIADFFERVESEWEKIPTVYFRDYDSKLFYTHHWGRGLSSEEGVFMVYDGQGADFGLAVHENTHSFMTQNWGDSSSFLSEGIATHLEVMATDKKRAHREALGFLKDGSLFPLEEMVALNIGSNESEAKVAYPASGSFVGFLLSEYGLDKFIKKWSGAPWQEVYGKPLNDLERNWLRWLTLE